MKRYQTSTFLLATALALFLPRIAGATILSSQPQINAVFPFPNENKYYGNQAIWSNETGATTTIYAIFIRAKLASSTPNVQIADITTYTHLGSTGTFECFNNLGNHPSGIKETLKCICGDYDTTSYCDVPPSHILQFNFNHTGSYVFDNFLDIEFSGLDLGAIPVGAIWVSGDDTYLVNPVLVYPNPKFAQMAWFLCDDVSTSTACVAREFSIIPPYNYGYSSSLCDDIVPESIFDVYNGTKKALCEMSQFLFVPATTSVANFQNLTTTFQQKAPFAYFYAISDTLSSLSSTSTPAFTLATTTGALNTSIFQPLKTGLTWILWLMFGVFCIKRIAKFDF